MIDVLKVYLGPDSILIDTLLDEIRSYKWTSPTSIWDEYTPIVASPDDNYYFGWALHQAKHPDAKEFHKWDQRKKTRYRQNFEARAEANTRHPRYQLHQKVMELARVQQVANVLTK